MTIHTVKEYYAEVEKMIHFGGTKKETAIRNAFYTLLNQYAGQRGLMLVPEITIKTAKGKNITPDGTIKDALRQDWGYWESKDEADDIDEEIAKEDIREMMIQHILTADIFNTIFDEPYFHRENNVAQELEKVLATFFTGAVRNTALAAVKPYYDTINAAAAGIADHHEKQKFLNVVYETFYLGLGLPFGQSLRPGMGTGTVQREETQRSDDCRKVQYIPIFRIQGQSHRPPAAGLHRQRRHDEHHKRNGKRGKCRL